MRAEQVRRDGGTATVAAADRRTEGRFDNQLRSANVKLLSFACTLEFQMKENGIIGCKHHIGHNESERDSWRHNAFVSCEGEQWQRVQKTAAAAGLPRDES